MRPLFSNTHTIIETIFLAFQQVHEIDVLSAFDTMATVQFLLATSLNSATLDGPFLASIVFR